MRLLLNPSYPVLEYELAAALHCVINAFWQRMQTDPNYRPTLQVGQGGPLQTFMTCMHPCMHSMCRHNHILHLHTYTLHACCRRSASPGTSHKFLIGLNVVDEQQHQRHVLTCVQKNLKF